MAWVKHDLSSRECFLPDLLKCLRLFSMSKYSLRKILNKEELVIKNPICTNIFIKGLDYFLCPDRFLGMSLTHRTSVEKEEHVVVLSGYDENRGFSQDTYCFVLATKKWQLLPKIPHSCLSDDISAEACAVSAGLWYLVSDTRISYFNPKENVWRTKNTKFCCHPSCTLTTFNEELYLIGGVEEYEDDVGYFLTRIVSCVFKYNPIFNERKQLASMETCRYGHCAVVLEDLIYVIGGEDDQTCLQSVESYDPSTNQWRKAPDLTNPRRCAAAVTVCGKIFVIGGYRDVNLAIIEPTCEIFDVGLNLWSLVSSPNVPRVGCGIVSVDNTVYVFGGEDDSTLLSSVECFDIKHNKWTQIDADMPECWAYVQASLIKLPKMFISS